MVATLCSCRIPTPVRTARIVSPAQNSLTSQSVAACSSAFGVHVSTHTSAGGIVPA